MSQFIENIARYVQQYAPQYGICVCSPIIAQAILESGSGTSELATKAHNYFGLKYRAGRCKTANGKYTKVGSEQNTDGSYTSQSMEWFSFLNMENGVIGYFDFINISNYSNLKGVTNPRTYLENIKNAGYATSLDYVSNLVNVIQKYNLEQYDTTKEASQMSTSIVDYTKISPNRNSPRNREIDTITIHCTAGECSVETLGNIFAPTSRKASSNYGVGTDGRIGMYCSEQDRSWCSSSESNDNRAITIEVSSGKVHPYTVSKEAYDGLIRLLVDICNRNPKLKSGLRWKGDKSLIGQVQQQNMTVHRWFANKACPGDYLYQLHEQIANEVNQKLGVSNATTSGQMQQPTQTSTPNTLKALDVIATEVIRGNWGNGAERKQRLTEAGYDYNAVQVIVNQLCK
ncbi:MAG: glucosaminidase domain-containing protein [Bacillota bacterium]